MGIEDRDWYREESAKKNGMFYNKKNATYSSADSWFNPKGFRRTPSRTIKSSPFDGVPVDRRGPPPMSPAVKFWVSVATVAICAFIFVVFKIISQIFR